MSANLYNTLRWRASRLAAIRRDGSRCTVARLLGGGCDLAHPLEVHHIVPVREGGAQFDLDNLGTACKAHHVQWEALRRALVERRRGPAPRCPHRHRTAEARRICEARLSRDRTVAA